MQNEPQKFHKIITEYAYFSNMDLIGETEGTFIDITFFDNDQSLQEFSTLFASMKKKLEIISRCIDMPFDHVFDWKKNLLKKPYHNQQSSQSLTVLPTWSVFANSKTLKFTFLKQNNKNFTVNC